MIPYPDKPWGDGQTFTYETASGDTLVGTYYSATNSWSFAIQEVIIDGDGSAVLTTDVYTTAIAGDAAVGRAHFDQSQPTSNELVTQQDVNWYLNDEIEKFIYYGPFAPPPVGGEQVYKLWFNTTSSELNVYDEDTEQWIGIQATGTIYYGNEAPDEAQNYKLWFDTDRLELLIWYNEQWFPVSIPPTQINVLREIVEGLEVSVTQVRADIVVNKKDIDDLALDVSEEREALKEEFDGKLATLEEELEQLAPSLERGSWNFTLSHPPGVGEYTMIQTFLDEDDQEALCNATYTQCVVDAGGDAQAMTDCNREYNTCMTAVDGSKIITTNDWTQCDELVFNSTDANGVTHNWAGIDSDHYIDVFNTSNEDFMVGDIAIHGGGSFQFDLVSSRGVATGLATIKIFKTEGTIDFDQYVRKSGDTITGTMVIRPDTGKHGLTVYPGPEAIGTTTDIITARKYDGRQVFYADQNGDVGVDPSWSPTQDRHLVPKKYVDQLRGPASLAWRWLGAVNGATTPEDGGFYKSGDYLRISFKTDNNIDLGDNLFADTQSLSTQYGPFGTIWKYNEADNKWQLMRQIRIESFRWNYNNHLEYQLSSSHGRSFDDLVIGETYYVTVGGFF